MYGVDDKMIMLLVLVAAGLLPPSARPAPGHGGDHAGALAHGDGQEREGVDPREGRVGRGERQAEEVPAVVCGMCVCVCVCVFWFVKVCVCLFVC